MGMTTPDIAGLCERLRAALEGVTPGPWLDHSYRSEQARVYTVCLPSSVRIARVHEGTPRRAKANAAFIAMSREAVPVLLDTLERQAAEIARLREALPDLSAVINWLAKGCAVDHAVTELIIYQARIDAALTGEDAATLGLSGKTQTDDRTRGDG